MNACESYEANLSALLDGELATEEAASLRSHLDTCASCRAALASLERTKEALALDFAALREAAPPAPAVVGLPRRDGLRSSFRSFVLGGLAAAAAMAALIFGAPLLRSPPIEAMPLELLARVAARHVELRDFEAYATLDSGRVEVFAQLSKKKEKRKPPPKFRVVARRPNTLLVHAVKDLSSRERIPGDTLAGYDGEQFWNYDPERQVVQLGDRWPGMAAAGTTMKIGKTDATKDLMRYLSWDFVKVLATEAGEHEIHEITGPADRRAKRRVFRLSEKPAKEGESRWAWDRTEITIDPEKNLIERMVFDAKLIGVSLVRITLELADVNNGFTAEDLDYRKLVPPGTRTVPAGEGK